MFKDIYYHPTFSLKHIGIRLNTIFKDFLNCDQSGLLLSENHAMSAVTSYIKQDTCILLFIKMILYVYY